MLSDTKRQAINLKNCCIWLVDLFELHMLQHTYNVKSGLSKILFYKTLNQPLSGDRIFNL